jgi:tetratricopeptide (TPR) repeat protein
LSLLLDALKRAEQEKRARGQPEGSATPSPVAREVPTPRMAPVSTPGLELQPMGSAAPQPNARNDAAHAAHVVFQAKAPAAGAAEQRSRGMVWATVGAVAVVVIAAGAYVWYSLSALNTQAVAQSRPRAALSPVPPPPGAPAATVAEPAPPSAAAVLASLPPAGIAPAPVAPPIAAVVAPIPVAKAPAAEDTVARLVREATAEPPPLRLDRSADAARRVPAEVASAYEALRTGNLPAARRGYEAALASDPGSLDARLGLATLEARSGNRAAAAAHYRRALESDPRNATASAGLAALTDFSRPDALEAQLRADLERAPASGALHYTLGSVLAAQGRWHEAQAEFFEAHRLDPGNADVMYNLAISLDHLGQARLAAGFYRQALDAAGRGGAQFDPAPVARRLAEIR